MEEQGVTYTIEAAVKRHVGAKHSTLRIMCIRKEIKAVKVGKVWHIPATELDRVFRGMAMAQAIALQKERYQHAV